ncbi:hypothetical protein K443DRAFT_89982, partial [Laccaria amethystina LaAM-08-1]
ISALRTFFYALTVFPEAQNRAQEDIDRVVACAPVRRTAQCYGMTSTMAISLP